MSRSGEESESERLRIDRWLWCARLFKTRTLAADAVRGGHVRLNGARVKPAHDVRIGDELIVSADDSAERELTVTAIPERRGPAAEAQLCYTESEASIERRHAAAERRALARAFAPPTEGRPDKRTRRLLLRARQRGDGS
jgi:ribosome-associated heat shock protein Hsp15